MALGEKGPVLPLEKSFHYLVLCLLRHSNLSFGREEDEEKVVVGGRRVIAMGKIVYLNRGIRNVLVAKPWAREKPATAFVKNMEGRGLACRHS